MGMTAQIRPQAAPPGSGRLAGAIGRLSAGDEAAGTANPIQAVLREIDETVLPRRITLRSETGAAVDLLVSNRRLYAVTVGGEAGADPSDPQEAAGIFARRLKAALGQVRRVTLHAARPEVDPDVQHIGCTAQALAQAIGVAFRANTAAGLEEFLAWIEAEALAWLRPGKGGAERSGGAADLIGPLRAFAGRTPEGATQVGGRAPLCSLLPLPDGRLVLSVSGAGRGMVAVLAEDRRGALLDIWHSLIAP